jgi:hypothetical protein
MFERRFPMADSVFVSYSRKDQEFVRRLAEDLNKCVDGGVWFDQSDIQAGDRWRDRITNGVRDAQVVVLVLSPDSAVSKYVLMELNLALEAGKKVIPILYRPVKLTGELDEFVRETQFIDLQRGSYADNFQVLVDALVSSGAARAEGERLFLRRAVKTDWGAVFRKIPGWAFAWSIGWAVFWFLIALLTIFGDDPLPPATVLVFSSAGALGGGLGGLLAGLFSMFALRRNAPSIAWRHMSPSIRIWIMSGPLGLVLSVAVTYVLVMIGAVTFPTLEPDCSTGGLGDCVGQIIGSALGSMVAMLFMILLIILGFVLLAWFLTGMFAGWLAIRHIRRLEPGITRKQSGWVMFGWGLGGLAGTLLTLMFAAGIYDALGL